MRPVTARLRQRIAIGLVVAAAACEGAASGLAPCQVYRPHIAKRQFDGRVGTVLIRNAGTRRAEVKVYHPDGDGGIELRWMVDPGKVLPLAGPEGERLALGNDWGLQVNGSCVRTLGEAAEWSSDEFALHWDGDSLRSGLGPDR